MKTNQKYTSEKTSLKQVAAVFKKVEWQKGTVNFDNGGGKYDLATDYLKKFGVENYVYDPFNRRGDHNQNIINALEFIPANTSTISNVLNVIKEKEARLEVLKLSKKYSGITFITVYEGNRSGVGKQTCNGYQRNKKLKEYLKEVRGVFDNVEVLCNVIIAS